MSASSHFQVECSNLLIPPGNREVYCYQDKPDLWWTKNYSQLRHLADAVYFVQFINVSVFSFTNHFTYLFLYIGSGNPSRSKTYNSIITYHQQDVLYSKTTLLHCVY